MKPKILKRFILISISLCTLITGIILACAGGDDWSDYYNSIFAPEVSHADGFAPLYRSGMPIYGQEGYYNPIAEFDSVNVSDWHKFFEDKVSSPDIAFLLYKCRLGEVDTLIFRTKNPQYPLQTRLKNNSILTYASPVVTREFLYYLGFAKRCEPFATYAPDWWDSDRTNNPKNDVPQIQKLIDGGKRSFLNAKSNFIKQRYLFQIVRLFFNSEQYDECLTFYQQTENLFTQENTIKYRIMGYVAGAYYKQHDFSKANYLYSKIYDKCPQMRIIAYQSFHPQEESDWQESLDLAQNVREKTVLWHLLGIYADPFRAIKEIYSLDAKSDLLDLLLVRKINIDEETILPTFSYWAENHNDSTYKIESQKTDPEFVTFISAVADKRNTLKPYLWELAAGYFHSLSGNYKIAEKYLNKASSETKNDSLAQDQIRILRLIGKVELYSSPNAHAEAEFAKELSWLKNDPHPSTLRTGTILSWSLSRLSYKYSQFGDLLKAQCLNSEIDNNFYNDSAKMKSLIAYMDKPSKTAFDNFILSVHPYSRNDLFEYQAINLVYQNKLAEAMLKFKEGDNLGSSSLLGDPFVIHINDCHDCDHGEDGNILYSKFTFLEKMITLLEKAKKEPKNAAPYYFEIANGFYNITYFGNARLFYSCALKTDQSMWEFSVDEKERTNPIYDCSIAEDYYKMALNASNNNEFKAKCFFMAAKCEHNAFYVNKPKDYSGDFKAGNYFLVLKYKYQKTKYFQEILNECGYFKTYIKS
jgi:hypothetical protein